MVYRKPLGKEIRLVQEQLLPLLYGSSKQVFHSVVCIGTFIALVLHCMLVTLQLLSTSTILLVYGLLIAIILLTYLHSSRFRYRKDIKSINIGDFEVVSCSVYDRHGSTYILQVADLHIAVDCDYLEITDQSLLLCRLSTTALYVVIGGD